MIAPGLKARLLGVNGWVLDQHPRQPRRRGARRSGVVQDEGREQEVGARLHPPAEPLSGSLQGPAARRADQLLPAARRQQRGLGQHRPGRLARLRRCSSRSTSSAATASWPRRSCSTWCCSSTSPSAPACRGIQEWLSFYFKSPMHAPGLYPEHDLFIQLMKLKNTLRYLMGEELDHAPGPRVLRLARRHP